jgi:imidazoleglycerol-phosphate dehydratase / histidinol-phosphatase
MSRVVAFLDRDGTLIEEPADEQVDQLGKIRFMPGLFAALSALRRDGYQLVMVTNQDGLGGPGFPTAAFETVQQFLLQTFASQDILFDAVFVCPHHAADRCRCRKPGTALVDAYIRAADIDPVRSVVVGDRDTDLAFASSLGLRGLRVRRHGLAEETWPQVVTQILARRAAVTRETRETRVQVAVNLDALEPIRADTGIGFFNHMLEQLAKHGGFTLELTCRGDLQVDEHHTVEDCALALGEALRRALADKRGVARYGFVLPMDESSARVAIDLSGRPFSQFSGRFARESVGGLPTELVPHFFRSLGEGLGAAIHVEVLGENTHHMVEACFKGVGRALRQAVLRDGRDLPSTKGLL